MDFAASGTPVSCALHTGAVRDAASRRATTLTRSASIVGAAGAMAFASDVLGTGVTSDIDLPARSLDQFKLVIHDGVPAVARARDRRQVAGTGETSDRDAVRYVVDRVVPIN